MKFNYKKYIIKNCQQGGKKKCKLEEFIKLLNEYILENIAEICSEKIIFPYLSSSLN